MYPVENDLKKSFMSGLLVPKQGLKPCTLSAECVYFFQEEVIAKVRGKCLELKEKRAPEQDVPNT